MASSGGFSVLSGQFLHIFSGKRENMGVFTKNKNFFKNEKFSVNILQNSQGCIIVLSEIMT